MRDAGDYVFRLKLDVSVDSRALARTLVKETSFRRVAVLYVQDQWGEGIAKNFSDEFVKEKGNVVLNEGFEEGTTDFKSLLLRVKNSLPDVIMIGAFPAQVGLIAKQARELGIKVQLTAYGGSIGEETIELGGKSLNGLIFLDEFDVDSTSEPIKGFVQDFQKKYGKKPNLFGAMGYDAYNLFAEAINKCSVDTSCIRDFLYATKNYSGVSGIFSFDDHGDVIKDLKLKEIQEGKFIYFNKRKA